MNLALYISYQIPCPHVRMSKLSYDIWYRYVTLIYLYYNIIHLQMNRNWFDIYSLNIDSEEYSLFMQTFFWIILVLYISFTPGAALCYRLHLHWHRSFHFFPSQAFYKRREKFPVQGSVDERIRSRHTKKVQNYKPHIITRKVYDAAHT